MQLQLPKRLFYSLLIVLLWLSFVVEGSHALFADGASLTGNAITTGTADLQISNSQNPTSTVFADTRPGFTYNLSPGQSDERYILLKNAGSADIPLDITAQAASQTGAADMPSSVDVEFTPVDGTGVATGAPISSSMSNLIQRATTLGVSIPKGETRRIKIKTTLEGTYTGQNQSIAYDLNFNGTQHLAP